MNGRILVGVDGSVGSKAALAWALEEGALHTSVVEAAIVWQTPTVLPPDVLSPVDATTLAESAGLRLADAIGAVGSGHTAVEIQRVVLEGDPAMILCERAIGTDLLVVGSRGHGTFAGLLLGSVSSKCADHSPVPVAIVRPTHGGDTGTNQRTAVVIVGVDGSPGSVQALRWALREAGVRGATVRAVSVWRGTEVNDDMALEWATFPSLARQERAAAENAMDHLEQVLVEVDREPVANVEPIIVEGDPAEVLCRMAATADLLVVGSRGHGGFAGLLLGSVSSKCARHSRSPVVIVPSERHDGPSTL